MNRDPHLPSPEVCDWLLSLEWSDPVPVSITNYLTCASASLGADEDVEVQTTKEAHELLQLDAKARAEAAELKRREQEADDLARKEDRERRVSEVETPAVDKETALLQAILNQIQEAEVSAIQAIGVLSVAATLMTSQSYDLSMRGDDADA